MDGLATWLMRISLGWQSWRRDRAWKKDEIPNFIKQMKFEMDDSGRFKGEAHITNHPELFDIGKSMMLYMDVYGDLAPNYVSLSALAPNRKLYTLTVSHDTSKPKHEIIRELKDEIAELKREVNNG
jgi:hypothetical protein